MTGDKYREARLQSRSSKQVKILKSFLKINLEEKKKKTKKQRYRESRIEGGFFRNVRGS